ncbi:MAG: prolyl oligopeptidase family serine peptidase [Anaerolineales bacterium]|nr:prolyl oligopeptidase family serine peptidase [Anaerolineales bacterium]
MKNISISKWSVVIVMMAWMLSSCTSLTSESTPTITPKPTNAPEPTLPPEPTAVPYFDQPGQYLETLQSGGETRWFAIFIPESYQHGTLTPLVFNFHGAGSTFQQQALISGMNELAEAEGFVVVYPQALPDNANVWFLADGTNRSLDVEFTQAIIDELNQKITIDPKRIYATGFSNGGGLVNSICCAMSNTFAAIAPVAGAYVYWAPCETTSSVSVIAIHGDDDTAVAYSGGGYSTPGWAGGWADRNGCDSTPSTSQPFDDITIETWDSCPKGVAVTLYTVAGGGHVWPGSVVYEGALGATENLNATEIIWDFFNNHPKP